MVNACGRTPPTHTYDVDLTEQGGYSYQFIYHQRYTVWELTSLLNELRKGGGGASNLDQSVKCRRRGWKYRKELHGNK